MSYWADEEAMIEDCESRSDLLTDWESDFISSLRDRIDSGGTLSDRQVEVLENIWSKVTGRG